MTRNIYPRGGGITKTFQFTEEQMKVFEEWRSNKEKVYTGAIGGRYTFSFTPTGIGEHVTVNDSVTGEILDLSDYDNW